LGKFCINPKSRNNNFKLNISPFGRCYNQPVINLLKRKLEKLVRPFVREKVFKAFKRVDRKLFVPEKFADLAYLDQAISLDVNTSISQPSLVAKMIDLLELKGDEKVLEIGTGSGYSSAILSLCCKEVQTIEIDRDLAEMARKRLENYENIVVYTGDGVKGLATKAPFDAIMVNATVRKIPQALIDQLNERGRMTVPIEGKELDSQILYVCQKNNKKLIKKSVTFVRFVPLVT
jgi:protein-L-isoaspartate(D-aspartate) O-methyltransferase